MAYNAIADSEIDRDSPITSVLMTKIRDNIEQNRADAAANRTAHQDTVETITASNSDTSRDVSAPDSTIAQNEGNSIRVRGLSGVASEARGVFRFPVLTGATLSVTRSSQSVTVNLTTESVSAEATLDLTVDPED